jgi:hypothetical protein
MNPKTELTKAEKDFVKEAKKAFFSVIFDNGGHPYAVGADHNSRCFSMEVTEIPDHDGGATYYLK